MTNRPIARSTSDLPPRSSDRALSLVSLLADHAGGIHLADAARAVGLSASTALRQLRALEAAGFATRDDVGRWAPGAEMSRIARRLAPVPTLVRLAEPFLAGLAAATGESAYLAEPLGPEAATYVATASGTHAIRHVGWLGERVPRARSAVGAALDGAVDADGVVVRLDAVEAGVTAVSAPVCHSGVPVAALSLVGPSFRLSGERLAAARRLVAEHAAALSRLAETTGGTDWSAVSG